DHWLAALQFCQIAQRLQNPRAQLSPAHRCERAIEHREQTRIPRTARFDQLEIRLRCCVEGDELRENITTQRNEMIDLPPKLMLQVMNDGAGRTDRCRHLCATKSIERFGFEMLAQGERRL